ncbi:MULTISPECIES: DUF3817 domain-containing protein [unclassified Ensifer]|uniref:DUF3817 domain-containing protein n=1 Tax=unclassified Ensifer TaxID=2633371 RepID=UPI000812CAED|nr:MULTISPECIES: DUF3817 domain-containing protein [unclassified Ensifer]OCO99620.1 hypothetical protein BC362_26205 [Ensifer sp. LC14]OCP02594.1 hypothetical protein BBX50_27805 [Ensifer sp. LC11]OCP02865.1 hypothetical protein BC374_27820 [Ensifer sp. LC13]OCP29885.1 hypothetical protein BC364_27925 [Ensifer sp. LC499]
MSEQETRHQVSRLLRIAAIGEGTTLLLLVFVGVPLKHGFGIAEVTRWLGPLHGLAFLTYIWAVINELALRDQPRGWAGKAVLFSFLPGGTFWYFRRSITSGR